MNDWFLVCSLMSPSDAEGEVWGKRGVFHDPIPPSSLSPPHAWIWFPLILTLLEHPSSSPHTVARLHTHAHAHAHTRTQTWPTTTIHKNAKKSMSAHTRAHTDSYLHSTWDSFKVRWKGRCDGTPEVPSLMNISRPVRVCSISLIQPPTNQLLPVPAATGPACSYQTNH